MAGDHKVDTNMLRRDTEQLVAQTAACVIENAKPFIRFQADMMMNMANTTQAFAKIQIAQTEALAQFSEQIGQQALKHQSNM